VIPTTEEEEAEEVVVAAEAPVDNIAMIEIIHHHIHHPYKEVTYSKEK